MCGGTPCWEVIRLVLPDAILSHVAADAQAISHRQGLVSLGQLGRAAGQVTTGALPLPQPLLRPPQAATPAVPLHPTHPPRRLRPCASEDNTQDSGSSRVHSQVSGSSAVPMQPCLQSGRVAGHLRQDVGGRGGRRACSQGWASACSAVRRLCPCTTSSRACAAPHHPVGPSISLPPAVPLACTSSVCLLVLYTCCGQILSLSTINSNAPQDQDSVICLQEGAHNQILGGGRDAVPDGVVRIILSTLYFAK